MMMAYRVKYPSSPALIWDTLPDVMCIAWDQAAPGILSELVLLLNYTYFLPYSPAILIISWAHSQ